MHSGLGWTTALEMEWNDKLILYKNGVKQVSLQVDTIKYGT